MRDTMMHNQVVLVVGPRKHRRAWLDQTLNELPTSTTVLRLRSSDNPTLARLALAELRRQVECGTVTDTLLVIDDPVWLARTPLGVDPANGLVADLVYAAAAGAGIRVMAAMNPMILKHGNLAGAVMARATCVFSCGREGAVERPRLAPAGLTKMLAGFTGRQPAAAGR